MDIELGKYTKIEFYDARYWCNGDTPLWVLRVVGTGWAPVEYPAGYVVPPPADVDDTIFD